MVSDFRNIRLNDANVAFDGLYYYTIDNTSDSLIQKSDDGTVAFSYPLNRNVTHTIISLCYEGIQNIYKNGPPLYEAQGDENGTPAYQGDPPVIQKVLPLNGMAFWTLESDGASGIIIRRFLIENFLAKETNTYTILNNSVGGGTGTGDSWNVRQMVLELYETKLWEKGNPSFAVNGGEAAGESTILLHDNLTGTGEDSLDLFGDTLGIVPSLPTIPDTGATLPLDDTTVSEESLLKRFKYDNGDIIIKSGMQMIIGPSSREGYEGQFETVTVQRDLTNSDHIVITNSGPGGYNRYGSNDGDDRFIRVPLTVALTKGFNRGDPVRFVKNIFLFNQNGNNARVTGDGTNTGALYVFRAKDGSFVLYKGGSDGSLFYNAEGATFSQRDRKIIYTKSTNSIFLEPNVNDLKFVKTGLLDNYDNSLGQPVTIYGLIATFGGELLRLQRKQEYNGSMQSWSTYNFVACPLFSLVTSINVSPSPQIISADSGTDKSLVTITVRDQYNQPIQGISVTASDDNSVGKLARLNQSPSTGSVTDVTNSNGQVFFEYYSGADDTAVLITATVSQLTV